VVLRTLALRLSGCRLSPHVSDSSHRGCHTTPPGGIIGCIRHSGVVMPVLFRSAQAPLAAFVGIWLLAVAPTTYAQTFKDAALEALYVADKTDELKRVSTARVAAQSDDAQAVLGVAMVALQVDDAAGRQAAIKQAQACVDKQPRAAACQYSLGVVLGVQAMTEGMLKAARSVSTVRDALVAANEIEPDWYPARSALVEFYVQAPGMMGGSKSKADELARTAPKPEHAKLLQARMAMVESKWETALQTLVAFPKNAAFELVSDARSWAVQTGLAMINAGQSAKAAPLLEKLFSDHALHAGPAYSLGRAKGELGAHEDAAKLYEKAAGLQDASAWPVLYRLGMAQEQLGRKDDAKASYKRYLANAKGQKKQQEDARKRLEQLGG
jgi:tetratricopeptide (TPR) repeat protein